MLIVPRRTTQGAKLWELIAWAGDCQRPSPGPCSPWWFPVGPAGAQPDNTTCDPGEVCVWEHDNYKGCFADIPVPGIDANWADGQPDWNTCGGVIDDKVSSYWNRGDRVVVFYTRDKYLGNSVCVFPGGRNKNIDQPTLEDRFSSHNNLIPEDQNYPGRGSPGPDGCDMRDFE